MAESPFILITYTNHNSNRKKHASHFHSNHLRMFFSITVVSGLNIKHYLLKNQSHLVVIMIIMFPFQTQVPESRTEILILQNKVQKLCLKTTADENMMMCLISLHKEFQLMFTA